MRYVDLLERYARGEGLELKAVVNLAFHGFLVVSWDHRRGVDKRRRVV
jgi:hypothetical protein